MSEMGLHGGEMKESFYELTTATVPVHVWWLAVSLAPFRTISIWYIFSFLDIHFRIANWNAELIGLVNG